MTAALDAVLTAAYTEEAELYAQALALAEQMAHEDPRGERVDALLTRVRAFLGQVETIEERLAAAKAQWQQEGQRPSGALAETLARVAGLIHRMQDYLNGARVHAELQKQELAPALDDCIRQQQMRRAYRRSDF